MTDLDKEPNFFWFFNINIALLFISGCWMIGSLMITTWSVRTDLHFLLTNLLFTSTVFANISFLISMIFSIMGMTQFWRVDKAKKFTAYALIIGLLFLAFTLLLFGSILVFTSSSRFITGGLD